MMSSQKQICPRAGPVSDGESRTPAPVVGVCPTGYGGGNLASNPESESDTTQSGTNNTNKGQTAIKPKTTPSKNTADDESDDQDIITKIVRSKPKKKKSPQLLLEVDMNKTFSNVQIELTSEDEASSTASKKKTARSNPES
ncbi:hypothetical protein ABEB36_006164 [Hypothenemus hampei]|uniref:Uncharacterized protein n=1 Tax=Hypothenemus hampei TaxID=57062 RepID=A0ABD1EPM1_HYPHA